MILLMISVAETVVDRNAMVHRILDPAFNPTIFSEGVLSFSTNIWIMDSRIYTLTYSRKPFGVSLSYFDLGEFSYQSDLPSELTFSFRPYSLELGASFLFNMERNLYGGIRFGYYENRVMESISSASYITASIRFEGSFFNMYGYFGNFSFMELFRPTSIKLPYILTLAGDVTYRKFQLFVAYDRTAFGTSEYTLSIGYTVSSKLKAYMVYTPNYDYSNLSLLLEVKAGRFLLRYKTYIPNYNLGWANVLTLDVEI